MEKKDILHIYVRVSGDKSAKRDNSIPAQEAEGKRIAERYNMDYQIHREGDRNMGTSATKDDLKNRPVLQELLDLCDSGVVKHIFYTEPDRLVRNPYVALAIKDVFKKNGVKFYTDGRMFDISNNDEDEFWSDFKNILSEREIRLKNKRIIRSLEESAKKGKWCGGVMLPYGFRRQAIKIMENGQIARIESGILEFHPEECKIVHKIFNMSLQGQGSATIAKTLNQEGILTRGRNSLKNGIKRKDRITGMIRTVKPENLIWRPGTVLGILKNPLYKGERHYKGKMYSIEPLIEPSLWQKAQDNLKKNNVNSQRNNKVHFYMLKGMLICKKCGKGLYGVIKPSSHMRVYMCVSKRSHECDMRSINIDYLNEVVWDNFKSSNFLLNKAIKELNDGKEGIKSKILEKRIKSLENRIESRKVEQKMILTLYGKGKISEERFEEKDKELENEKSTIQVNIDTAYSELVYLQAKKGLTMPTEEFINEVISSHDNKTETEKREILKKYVHQVIIDFDSEESAHIVKVIFNLELKLAPLIYRIPVNDPIVAWEHIGYEDDDGHLLKGYQSEEESLIATESSRLWYGAVHEKGVP